MIDRKILLPRKSNKPKHTQLMDMGYPAKMKDDGTYYIIIDDITYSGVIGSSGNIVYLKILYVVNDFNNTELLETYQTYLERDLDTFITIRVDDEVIVKSATIEDRLKVTPKSTIIDKYVDYKGWGGTYVTVCIPLAYAYEVLMIEFNKTKEDSIKERLTLMLNEVVTPWFEISKLKG